MVVVERSGRLRARPVAHSVRPARALVYVKEAFADAGK